MKSRPSTPTRHAMGALRPERLPQLLDELVVNTTTPYISDSIPTAPYRRFALYLKITSTSTPTTVRIEVQFLDANTGEWHTLAEGPFTSLYYEDVDTASGLNDVLHGHCVGRDLRLKLTGAGTTSSAYFTVSASVDLWD